MQNSLAFVVILTDLILLQIPELPAGVETPVTLLAAVAALKVIWAGWQKKDQRGDDQMAAIVNKMMQMQERQVEVLAGLCKDLAELTAKQTTVINELTNKLDKTPQKNA
jgi:hypothetical protein